VFASRHFGRLSQYLRGNSLIPMKISLFLETISLLVQVGNCSRSGGSAGGFVSSEPQDSKLLFAKVLRLDYEPRPIHGSICFVLRVDEAVGDGP
jgi:hypothetical protein